MEIFREFTFEAAHHLPHAPEGHKCRRMHGHTYHVTVRVEGQIDPASGWVMDFGDLKAAFAPIRDALDHHCLNDVAGLENPTSESLARWVWTRLSAGLPGLCEVVIQETCCSGCTYRGD
jgi:6-pyruvoyltetrahydropterin/6-carboxytetrahydropterin synthase